MKTRQLGSLVVPVVGLGTNNFGTDFFGKSCSVDDAVEIVSAALDAGVSFLDTAEEYSSRSRNGVGQSEQFIGEALRRLGTRREDVIIATKFTVHGHTLLELAISWLTSQDFVGSVIAGATSAAQVTANARSASWNLTHNDLDEIAALLTPGQADAL